MENSDAKNNLPTTIHLKKDCYTAGSLIEHDERHQLKVSVDNERNDAYLEFTSREALYDFALALLYEAVYGHGEIEYNGALIDGNKHLFADGVRQSIDSGRLFIGFS